MKILITHNRYQTPGGEDAVVAAEAGLLESRGHRVVKYQRHNDELKTRGAFGNLAAGIETVWATAAVAELKALIAREKPDVAHFHNTFPLISPAAYYACADSGVPVVQTLHNYRLFCPAATLLRDGKICEECLGKFVPWAAVAHACYHDSRAATGALAAMLATHRALGTWQRKVETYIALSEFSRQKFIQGGLPPERIVVKPNFVFPDPGPKREAGEYALFAGYLAPYKGLRTLLDAWKRLGQAIPLRIAGDGPLLEEIRGEIKAGRMDGIELLGRVPTETVRSLMHGARFLVFPSLWYEGFPMSIAEAFACGLPVIASRLGSLAEIVCDGETGFHFAAGDPVELAEKVERAWNNTDETRELGWNARRRFEQEYTGERNYGYLMDIYGHAAAQCRSTNSRTACSEAAPAAPDRKLR